jgi:CBS domain-containing protein
MPKPICLVTHAFSGLYHPANRLLPARLHAFIERIPTVYRRKTAEWRFLSVICRFLPCSQRLGLRFFKNNDNTREATMKTVAQLLKLKDQKNQEVHQIKPDHMVLEALMKMAEKNVGALLVVENDEVLGIISERDYARKLVLHGRSSVGTPVRDIMVSPVITVDTHQTVDTCLGIMSDRRLRHLPVVENGKLIGLLSIGDLVKEAIAEQAELIRQLEQYIRGE